MQECSCTKCGAIYESDARFCGFDRSPLVRRSIDDSSDQLVIARSCPRCMRRYPSHSNYCGIDGSQLQPLKRQLPSIAKTMIKAEPPDSQALTINKAAAAEIIEPASSVPKSVSNSADTKAEAKVAAQTEGPQLILGRTLDGKYQIDAPFAEGGMSQLYLAHHLVMDRAVVVKVMHGSLLDRADAIKRFERECKLLARLNHPNIVSVYDFGVINGKQPYFVMEYIQGMTLSAHLERNGAPSIAGAARITSQICLALEEAHAQGIVHRDLKPDNIILQDKTDRPDWVKLVDFGIAHLLENMDKKRLTRTGRIVGTPQYMSPEQISDKPLDARSDVYCMGLVIFELLTGRPACDPEDALIVMAKRLLEKSPPVSKFTKTVEPGSKIELLVSKCLEKDPSDRFQTMTELRNAVDEAFESFE